MVTIIQYVLFFLLPIVLQISAQRGFPSSIACYTKYEHEEGKNIYSHQQSLMSRDTTSEGERCSKVRCACFSYRSICSSSSSGSNHYSPCTDEDQQNGVIKWHRGLTSHAQCEQMRQNPHTYRDLTCCYTDKCNNQLGTTTSPVPDTYKSLPPNNSLSSRSFSNWMIFLALFFCLFAAV